MFANFVERERLRIFERVDSSGYFGYVSIPPLVAEIIHEATSPDDLLKTAVGFRDRYRALRGWLGELQRALDAEDPREIIARKKVLIDIATGIAEMAKESPVERTSIEFSAGWLTVSVNPASFVRALKSRIGVRAQIERLILTKGGVQALRRLFMMFGEDRTARAMEVEQELLNRHRRH